MIPKLSHVEISNDGAVSIKETRADVELYGHAFAPDHLLDGTIRHPASTGSLSGAVREVGFAAEERAKTKLKGYPLMHGESILPCSMETWGYCGKSLTAILGELAGLAGRRQRDRGVVPTR